MMRKISLPEYVSYFLHSSSNRAWKIPRRSLASRGGIPGTMGPLRCNKEKERLIPNWGPKGRKIFLGVRRYSKVNVQPDTKKQNYPSVLKERPLIELYH